MMILVDAQPTTGITECGYLVSMLQYQGTDGLPQQPLIADVDVDQTRLFSKLANSECRAHDPQRVLEPYVGKD